MALVLALLIITPFVLTKLITPKIADMLRSAGAVRVNYLGVEIPTAAGISVVFAAVPGYILAAWFYLPMRFSLTIFAAGILGMSFLGLLDDLIGTREITGLRGHLKALLRGRLTTGGLKAVGGIVIAAGFSVFFSEDWLGLLGNSLLVALFTNALNLYDLRPGRAVKVFLMGGTLFFIYGFSRQYVPNEVLVILPALGAALAFLRFDLGGKMMLGDTGSNALGISLGMAAVLLLPGVVKWALVVLLVLLHIYTEKYSLTDTIERIKILRYLDEWGRT